MEHKINYVEDHDINIIDPNISLGKKNINIKDYNISIDEMKKRVK